jgi:uncharacterized protein YaeQ
MAQPSTVRRFDIELSDSDRGVYERLELRVAQHPSESDRYLVTRIIARCLEHAEGLDFSKGICVGDEPALWRHDATGRLLAWIEVGLPSVERLHKASKTGARVAVYGWRGLPQLLAEVGDAKVHRGEALELFGMEPAFLDGAAAKLERGNRWELSVVGGALYLTIAGSLHEGQLERLQ